jgi:hypothetical protein
LRVSDQEKSAQRRGKRVRPGPLRVDIPPGRSGTVVDLSESGALLELPAPADVNSHLSLDLHWEGIPVRLQGRVVRSTPCYEGASRVAWVDPAGYHVAVEFFDLAAQCAMTLREVLQKAGEAAPGQKR